MPEVNACFDEIDDRNYIYNDIFGSEDDNIPEEFVMFPEIIENQWIDQIMRMSCTRQSPCHIVNAQNENRTKETWIKSERVQVKPIWLERLKEYPLAETQWDSILSGLKQMKSLWHITGYSVLSSEMEMKQSIIKWRLIATGSKDWNWSKVRAWEDYEQRTDGKMVWHAFCIVGYTTRGWIWLNSYWPDNWPFIIPYSLTNTLFTRYAVLDERDEEAILLYKKRIMSEITIEDAKKALEAKIWNGTDPKKPASREEMAAVVYRAIEKLKQELSK